MVEWLSVMIAQMLRLAIKRDVRDSSISVINQFLEILASEHSLTIKEYRVFNTNQHKNNNF